MIVQYLAPDSIQLDYNSKSNLWFRGTDIKFNYRELLILYHRLVAHDRRGWYNESKLFGYGPLIQEPAPAHVLFPDGQRTDNEIHRGVMAIKLDSNLLNLPDQYPYSKHRNPSNFELESDMITGQRLDLSRFATLPPELRLRIWKYACQVPRIIEISAKVWPFNFPMSQETLASLRPSAILQVNRESREIALRYYKETQGILVDLDGKDCWDRPFYFNPSFDTVVLGPMFDAASSIIQSHYDKLYYGNRFLYNPDFLRHIQYFALCDTHCGYTDKIITKNLPAVKEVLMILGSALTGGVHNHFQGARPIPKGFKVGGFRERLDSELVGSEPQQKLEINVYIKEYRTPGHPRYFPNYPDVPHKFVTVVDADGNEPAYIMNPFKQYN